VQKYRPSLNVKVKGQRSRSPGTKKNKKTAELSPLTMHCKACDVGRTQQAATDDTVGTMTSQQAWRHSGYAGGKISACCL